MGSWVLRKTHECWEVWICSILMTENYLGNYGFNYKFVILFIIIMLFILAFVNKNKNLLSMEKMGMLTRKGVDVSDFEL